MHDVQINVKLSPEALWERARHVEGWLSQEQAKRLAAAAAQVPRGQWIVEIGSRYGRSTIVLAGSMPGGARMMCVDPGRGAGSQEPAELERSLVAAGLRERVDLCRNLSDAAAEVWNGASVGLLYIDGCHELGSVLARILQQAA